MTLYTADCVCFHRLLKVFTKSQRDKLNVRKEFRLRLKRILVNSGSLIRIRYSELKFFFSPTPKQLLSEC